MTKIKETATAAPHHQNIEHWRVKFDDAFESYHTAANEHLKLRQAKTTSDTWAFHRHLESAKRAEVEAHREYCRIVKIFTFLKRNGRLPL